MVHVTILLNGKEENKWAYLSCEAHTCNPPQHESTRRNGMRYHCEKDLTQFQSESIHSKILVCAAQEWSGSRSWYSLRDSTCFLPNCPCIAIQCACLLPKCPLKAYNVSAGY